MQRKELLGIGIYTLVVAFLLFIFAGAITWKLIDLVSNSQAIKVKIERLIKEFDIEPKRGNLYSDDGSLLATSVTKYSVYFDAVAPSQANFEANISALSDSLIKFYREAPEQRPIGKTSSQIKNILQNERSNQNRYVRIARNLGYTHYKRVKNFPLLVLGANKGGRIIEQTSKREYPIGNIARRFVGSVTVDENNYVTRIGLEGAFDTYLAGKKGKQLKQKIAKGQWKPIDGSEEREPQDGYDVVSTINVNIQDIAHHSLLEQLEKYKAEHGCAVVMEVNTGEIKAISNLGRSTTGTYYERINYAVGEAYEPGSVFKIMSAIVAMEEAAIDTTYTVDTKNGVISFFGRKVRDSNRRGYGTISLAKALEVSSNTHIVQMTHDLFHKKPEVFVNKLAQMHLNTPLGLPILGEGEPYIPHPKKKGWHGIALEWMAYGYGLKMTPLQVLTFYNAIANNGVMVRPQMIKEVREWNNVVKTFDVEVMEQEICSPETIQKIKKVLENAVKRGTGKSLYSPDFSMAGKTGTAQANYADKSKLGYISSFAGFFPADKPKYSCIVVIHNPDKSIGYYGADVSGPVFKSIAQKIYTNSLLVDVVKNIEKVAPQVKKDYQHYYKVRNTNRNVVPNVIGMNAMDAIALLENLGVQVQIIGSGKVIEQSVVQGEKIKNIQKIVLTLK